MTALAVNPPDWPLKGAHPALDASGTTMRLGADSEQGHHLAGNREFHNNPFNVPDTMDIDEIRREDFGPGPTVYSDPRCFLPAPG